MTTPGQMAPEEPYAQLADERPTSWSDAPSRDALQLIAEGVTQLAGFGIAAISVVRDNGTLEQVAVAGKEAARLEGEGGGNATVDQLLQELTIADDWGLLRF